MLWLRTAVALFVLAHGFGHSIWFLSAWSRGDGLVDDWPLGAGLQELVRGPEDDGSALGP